MAGTAQTLSAGPRAALVLLVALALATGSDWAGDWPLWRGASCNGAAAETGLPARFSLTENLAWSTPMPGPGGSTPIVWGDRLFVSSVDAAADPGVLVALCLDIRTGAVLWRREAGPNRNLPQNTMASPSPVTDGTRVYFHFGTGILAAFDLAGAPVWQRELEKDHGHNALMFGYSSSPLLYRGRLYVVAIRNSRQERYGRAPAAAAESYLLAVDPATGRDLWKVARPTDAREESQEAYTTPIPYESGARAEILVCGADYLTGHDPATGRELWRWGTYNPQKISHWRIVPSPVVADGLVIVAGPKHSRLFAIRPPEAGAAGEGQVAWTFDKQIPDASTPLLYQGRLYLLDDDRRVLTCLDPATGQQKGQLRLEGQGVFRASPLGTDGRIYCIDEGGEVFVLAAGDQPALLQRLSLGSEKACRSSIVAAGGRLFIRTSSRLLCVARLTGSVSP